MWTLLRLAGVVGDAVTLLVIVVAAAATVGIIARRLAGGRRGASPKRSPSISPSDRYTVCCQTLLAVDTPPLHLSLTHSLTHCPHHYGAHQCGCFPNRLSLSTQSTAWLVRQCNTPQHSQLLRYFNKLLTPTCVCVCVPNQQDTSSQSSSERASTRASSSVCSAATSLCARVIRDTLMPRSTAVGGLPMLHYRSATPPSMPP